jgi:hypothetical protein
LAILLHFFFQMNLIIRYALGIFFFKHSSGYV